jgi:hypothetical protein
VGSASKAHRYPIYTSARVNVMAFGHRGQDDSPHGQWYGAPAFARLGRVGERNVKNYDTMA